MGAKYRIGRSSLGTCFVLCAFAAPALAVEPVDKFSVWVSGYLTKFDTDLRADGESSSGTPVDLERDLALQPSNFIATFGANWRPFDHHQFGLAYFGDSNRATHQLDRTFVFQEQTYEASATIDAKLNSDVVSFQYVWWAAMHERWALGPQFGLIWYSFKLSIDMQLDVNGNDVSGTRQATAKADLPTPSLGFLWSWTPHEDWRISTEAGYFKIKVDTIDAEVLFGRAAVEWFPWERTGFRFDVIANDASAESNRRNFSGKINFLDSGLRLGVVYRF